MSDTLVIDSARIAQWQAQNDFDYNRELAGGGMTFTEWMMQQLNELLQSLFGQAWRSDYTWWTLTAVGALIVGIAVWYVWRFHPGLFMRKEDEQQTYEETEDTIYGVDFDAVISQSLSRGDYREAIRMVYLRTLKALSDSQQINWQLFKTPSQYVRELPDSAAFRMLTAHFLRVRYGNFSATRQLFDEVENLGKEVTRES